MKRPARLLRRASEPWIVLPLLAVAQWVAVLVFALSVPHNGWLFYQGGDQTYFYTTAWALGDGNIIEAKIGYGWSYLLMPIPLLLGANIVAALPAIVLLQTVVLLPIALLAMYGIAARLGGRAIGYFAAVLWVLGPYLTILLWDERYHDKYVEQYLPQALGMSGLGDFPSMVTLLVAAYLLVRALETRGSADFALAGLATAFAIGIKPVNVLFLLGPALAFAFARQLRGAAVFALSLLPGLLALALWKYRGLGHLPALTPDYSALAAGANTFVAATSSPLDRYIDFDWSLVENNLAQLREYFWSPRALQWVPIAGVIAAGRRSLPIAGLLGGWLGAYLLVRLTSPASTIEQGTFLRLFMPGLPPLILLAAAIPLLVPRGGPRLANRFALKTRKPLRWRSWPVVTAWVVIGVLPLVLFAVLKPLDRPAAAKYFENNVIVPVEGQTLEVRADVTGQGRSIVWKPPTSLPADVFYRVLRAPAVGPAPDPTLPPGREGIRCLAEGFDFYGGAADCRIEMDLLGTTRGSQWLDTAPLPRGRWTYRVALAANWIDSVEHGDVLLVSPPATVSVG